MLSSKERNALASFDAVIDPSGEDDRATFSHLHLQ